MKSSIRRILAAGVTLSLAATVFGCSVSQKTSESSRVSSPATSNVTLSMLWPSDNPVDGIKAECAAFKKETGIKVDIEISAGDLDSVVKSRIATNDLPDILGYNPGSLLSPLNPAAHFLDLTNESYMSNVDDQFKKAVTVNGKVYGIPSGAISVGGVLYNKNVYKKLGLSIPTNWDQFLSNSKQIQKSGITAVLFTAKDSWSTQYPVLGDYYNVEKSDSDFAEKYTENKSHYSDTKAALRSFEKLSQLKSEGLVNKDYMSVSYDAGEEKLANGTAAQWIMGSGCLSDIAKKYPDKLNDFDMFPIPSDDSSINGFTVWEPMAFYFSKDSEHLDAVKQWAAYMTSKDAIDVYAKAQQLYGPIPIKGFSVSTNAAGIVKTIEQFVEENKCTTALEFKSPVKGPDLANICVECLSGQKTAAQCAKEYDNDVVQQAKQLNLKGWN